MTSRDIKTTLAELHDELEKTPQLDEDLREMLMEVDSEIHALLSTRDHAETEVKGVHDRMEALAADFAAKHPNTEVFFREVINALGRMGI
jgi:predicted nuclease with TOPRIM domain